MNNQRSGVSHKLFGLGLALASSVAGAQPAAENSAEAGVHANDVHFAVAQKFWYASFESTPLVARVVVPSPGAEPVVQASLDSSTSSKLMPITAVSASWRDWSASASATSGTTFSNPDAPGGSLSRDEYDFAFGYAMLHSNDGRGRLSLLADYKIGEVKPISGSSATELLGVTSNVRVSAILLGLTGSAPLVALAGHPLVIYGNAAFGTGHSRFSTPLIHTLSTRYSISELGLSCPANGTISFQLGYRTQTFTLHKAPFVTVSTSSPGTILTSQTRSVQSSTQGPIAGMTAVF